MLADPRAAKTGRAATSKDANFTCTTLYSKYDAQRLVSVVGTERASRMLTTDRAVHMFVPGGDEEIETN